MKNIEGEAGEDGGKGGKRGGGRRRRERGGGERAGDIICCLGRDKRWELQQGRESSLLVLLLSPVVLVRAARHSLPACSPSFFAASSGQPLQSPRFLPVFSELPAGLSKDGLRVCASKTPRLCYCHDLKPLAMLRQF